MLATERSQRGVHDAIAHGRTCVRSPEACSLELRDASTASPAWIGVGGTLQRASRIQAPIYVNCAF